MTGLARHKNIRDVRGRGVHILRLIQASSPLKACLLCVILLTGCTPDWRKGSTVTVQTFLESPNIPVEAGLPVLVDGVNMGSTNSDGALTLQIKPGKHRFASYIPYLAGASETVTTRAGQEVGVELILKGEGLSRVIDYILETDAAPVLPSTATSVSSSFADRRSGILEPNRISSVTVEQRQTRELVDLTDRFEILSDGTIRSRTAADLSPILGVDGEQQLRILAESAEGFSFVGEATFRVGRYRVAGRLAAPPSNPDLSVSGASVDLQLLGTTLRFSAVSDEAGRFTLDGIPAGNIALNATRQAGGITYSSTATAFLDHDVAAVMNLLGPADYAAGVPPIIVSPTTDTPSVTQKAVAKQRAADAGSRRQASLDRPQPRGLGPAAEGEVRIIVRSAGRNYRVPAWATLTVPRGTESVLLSYFVGTNEDPDEVLKQGIFNDNWDLVVVASNGQRLPPTPISRSINSQITVEPVWYLHSSGHFLTAEINSRLDVSALTTASDIELILAASATDIGDDVAPTYVVARLALLPEPLVVKIVDVIDVGGGAFFSVPRIGRTNTYPKAYKIAIVSPPTATTASITKVKAELVGAGMPVFTIFEGMPQILDQKKFLVWVTFGEGNPGTSPVSGVPPPAQDIQYKFTVEGMISGAPQTAEVFSPFTTVLWRMPDGLPRFADRDVGCDDWVSKGTYEWMQANSARLTRVNDVSGEHGRDIGHTTHKRGTDIDIFHFGAPLASSVGVSSIDPTNIVAAGRIDHPLTSDQVCPFVLGDIYGILNYRAAERLATQAADGNESARQRLRAWIVEQRVGLSSLAELDSVSEILTLRGARDRMRILPLGWAWSLLRSGGFTSSAGRVVRIDSGSSLSSKIKSFYGHDDHHHVTLNPASPENSPGAGGR